MVPVRLDEAPSEEMLSAMTDDVRRMIDAHKSTKEKQIEGESLLPFYDGSIEMGFTRPIQNGSVLTKYAYPLFNLWIPIRKQPVTTKTGDTSRWKIGSGYDQTVSIWG